MDETKFKPIRSTTQYPVTSFHDKIISIQIAPLNSQNLLHLIVKTFLESVSYERKKGRYPQSDFEMNDQAWNDLAMERCDLKPEFLSSFLRSHSAGKPVVASRNVGFFSGYHTSYAQNISCKGRTNDYKT